MIFERGYFDSNRVQDSAIKNSLNESRNFSTYSAYSAQPTVFLSHKHEDLKDLQGVVGKLQEHGAKIYIDSMDNKMPNQTSAETAARIKEVIKFCNKFVLLGTDKAIESYWCNWELGIGDIHKYINHIAILPMKEKGVYDFQYKGNEYMQLYPQIDYENGLNRYQNGSPIYAGYYVSYPVDKNGIRNIISLREWLSK